MPALKFYLFVLHVYKRYKAYCTDVYYACMYCSKEWGRKRSEESFFSEFSTEIMVYYVFHFFFTLAMTEFSPRNRFIPSKFELRCCSYHFSLTELDRAILEALFY